MLDVCRASCVVCCVLLISVDLVSLIDSLCVVRCARCVVCLLSVVVRCALCVVVWWVLLDVLVV